MRWLIFCNECMGNIDPDNIAGIFDAKYGPQDTDEPLEGFILVCADFDDYQESMGCQPYICDGEDCDQIVAVSKSSKWFTENHKAEREGA